MVMAVLHKVVKNVPNWIGVEPLKLPFEKRGAQQGWLIKRREGSCMIMMFQIRWGRASETAIPETMSKNQKGAKILQLCSCRAVTRKNVASKTVKTDC